MTGNTREFKGVITGYDLGECLWEGSRMVACEQRNTVTLTDRLAFGDSFDVRMCDGMEDARELVGRRVRVTVEVLDG